MEYVLADVNNLQKFYFYNQEETVDFHPTEGILN